jgi:microsomal dipeptidase-like Zn-dependent dipeptidase
VDRSAVGAILGLEGSHALNDAVGAEFEELYRRGLRMIAPTHRFDNAFAGSSEGCLRYGLTPLGEHLIGTAIARGMIVDMAHASSPALGRAIEIAAVHRHPVAISHSGLRSFLKTLPACCDGHAMRANTDEELIAVAQTGGVFGVGFWREVIGKADVDHVVAAIRHGLEVLRPHEGRKPIDGLRTITRASQHLGLGSDWDGAVKTAIDAAQVGLITEGLMAAGIPEDQIADIMGRNVCRVAAQSLARGTFDEALKLCDR